MPWTSATTASDHRSRADGRPPLSTHQRRTSCSDSVYTSAWVIHIAVGKLARHSQYPFTPPPEWGFSLPVVYAVWLFVVVALIRRARRWLSSRPPGGTPG